MTRQYPEDLIKDLAQLVARHGRASLLEFTTILRDPQSANELADLLQAADATRTRGRSSHRSPGVPGSRTLAEIKMSDPAKHDALVAFRDDLVRKMILPTMQEIRQFSNRHGLPIGSAGSRINTIAPLIRGLSELSTETITELLLSLHGTSGGDRSLEDWSDLILRRRRERVPTTGNDESDR